MSNIETRGPLGTTEDLALASERVKHSRIYAALRVSKSLTGMATVITQHNFALICRT